MKRKAKAIGMISVGFLLSFALGEPVYAGSLNANEQELMSIIRGTYTYNGVTYRVKDIYIKMSEDYLLQDDVDCTDEQKQKALDKMYSSIQQGIDEGYLEPIAGQTGSSGSEGISGESQGNANPGSSGNGGADGAQTGGEEPLQTEPETTAAPVIVSLEAYAGKTAASESVEAQMTESAATEETGADESTVTEETENETEETERELSTEKTSVFPDFPQASAGILGGIGAALTAAMAVLTGAAAKTKLFRHHKRRSKGNLS